ncbi:MAG: ABC transporter substrate-binding protein, partial [Lachnospiraceae bacterium]|nr:ABC transporter substrate-binding protein [Lachnospiraceae bacterium]
MKKRTQKLLSVLLTAALTAGTFGTCFAGAEEVSDTFTFVSTEPNTLNMIESSSNLDDYVFYLTNAMLYRSIDGEVTAELCDSMEVSDDGCTYTYTIKEAYYTDGSQIVADDFVYYFVKHYITSSNYSYFVGGEDTYNDSLDTCEGVYSLDDSTFVVTLVQPTTAFDGLLEIYPLNQAFAEEKGDALGGTPDDLMYSGPYVLTEWVVGSYMTFVKNDSYINADTLFPTENLKMMVSTDSSTTYSMYLNGEVDAIISVNSDLSEMLGVENCTWYSSGNVWGLEFNTTGCTYT